MPPHIFLYKLTEAFNPNFKSLNRGETLVTKNNCSDFNLRGGQVSP